MTLTRTLNLNLNLTLTLNLNLTLNITLTLTITLNLTLMECLQFDSLLNTHFKTPKPVWVLVNWSGTVVGLRNRRCVACHKWIQKSCGVVVYQVDWGMFPISTAGDVNSGSVVEWGWARAWCEGGVCVHKQRITDMEALDTVLSAKFTSVCWISISLFGSSLWPTLMEFKILFVLTSSCGLSKKLKSPRVKAIWECHATTQSDANTRIGVLQFFVRKLLSRLILCGNVRQEIVVTAEMQCCLKLKFCILLPLYQVTFCSSGCF